MGLCGICQHPCHMQRECGHGAFGCRCGKCDCYDCRRRSWKEQASNSECNLYVTSKGVDDLAELKSLWNPQVEFVAWLLDEDMQTYVNELVFGARDEN